LIIIKTSRRERNKFHQTVIIERRFWKAMPGQLAVGA